ncbi:hypothetical protein [Streptomyces decoyicus]|uniref:hypothetical protein n=1 Tax=Streptomyces decoyicus TaxID=249567 RepID=UPI00386F9389
MVGNVVVLAAPQVSTELPVFRRPLVPAAALVASASLVLTACGGGDDSPKAAEGIPGADEGKRQSASPTAKPSVDPNAKNRPTLKADAGLKAEFEGWSSKDRKINDILLDGKFQVLAVNSGIFKLDPHAPELAFYNEGAALESAQEWVSRFKSENHTLTGRVRYYDPRVKFLGKTYVSLSYCSDESKAFSKEIKSGKTLTTTPSAKSYVLNVTGMRKGSEGIWKTNSLSAKRGGCKS